MVNSISTRQNENPRLLDSQSLDEDRKAAESQVASLWYQSSIKSLAEPQAILKDTPAIQIEKKSAVSEYLGKAKNWLWGLFSWGKKEPVVEPINNSPTDQMEATTPLDGAPQLSPPEKSDKKRLTNALADLNRDLVHRLKDMAEFEEEMNSSGPESYRVKEISEFEELMRRSQKSDKLIFTVLVNCTRYQKRLQEEASSNTQHILLNLNERNKAIQHAYFDILDEINSINKTQKILGWTNIGTTVLIMGGLAGSIFTGGASLVISAGAAAASIGKGAVTLTTGIYKYSSDRKTGNLYVIGQERKTNSARINDELTILQTTDEDIASLLKMIRHQLDNQSKAERGSFGQA